MNQPSTLTASHSPPSRPWGAPLLGGLAVLWLVMLLAGGAALDRWLIINAHVSERPWVLPVLFVTRLGDWEILLSLPFFAAGWLLLQRRKRAAFFLIGAVIAGRLLVMAQKMLLGRLRPEEHEHLVRVDSFAFPSGHAANSLIVYALLAVLLVQEAGRRRIALAAALLLSLLIGISRVLLGVHWPSDVIGGWCFGASWVIVSLEFARRRSALNPS